MMQDKFPMPPFTPAVFFERKAMAHPFTTNDTDRGIPYVETVDDATYCVTCLHLTREHMIMCGRAHRCGACIREANEHLSVADPAPEPDRLPFKFEVRSLLFPGPL